MYKVLCIEDDPMVREVNRQFIERVEGFTVIDFAKDGREGLQKIEQLRPHLVFMDVYMPQLDGLETLALLRAQDTETDVIMVTAATNVEAINRAMHLGIFDYILKPFSMERVAQALEKYKPYKALLTTQRDFTQQQLDRLLHTTETPVKVENITLTEALPKGLNKATLDKILQHLHGLQVATSAEQLASQLGIARVTARRYLDFLEKQQIVSVDIQYGQIGRPMNLYAITAHKKE